ncbi:hypothetical protein HZS_3709, partial [Henneguya salminicola]
MLPTYLSHVHGKVKVGRYTAIDLGGTNFRFFILDILDGKLTSKAFYYPIPEKAMTGDGDDLFDFMAKSIEDSLIKMETKNKEIDYLGFSFSFPFKQLALNKGLLMQWTKGFSTKNVVGKEIVSLLDHACRKLNLKVLDYALINDATGTLLCGAFENQDTVIGIINGTGFNACYVEDVRKIKKNRNNTSHKKVLINTEFAAFGEAGGLNSILTEFDLENDGKSMNPGKHIYEKTISGLYLGEIVRLIL